MKCFNNAVARENRLQYEVSTAQIKKLQENPSSVYDKTGVVIWTLKVTRVNPRPKKPQNKYLLLAGTGLPQAE